jgi:hypothetical protein
MTNQSQKVRILSVIISKLEHPLLRDEHFKYAKTLGEKLKKDTLSVREALGHTRNTSFAMYILDNIDGLHDEKRLLSVWCAKNFESEMTDECKAALKLAELHAVCQADMKDVKETIKKLDDILHNLHSEKRRKEEEFKKTLSKEMKIDGIRHSLQYEYDSHLMWLAMRTLRDMFQSKCFDESIDVINHRAVKEVFTLIKDPTSKLQKAVGSFKSGLIIKRESLVFEKAFLQEFKRFLDCVEYGRPYKLDDQSTPIPDISAKTPAASVPKNILIHQIVKEK